jgi:hypothetical protein
MQSESGMAFLYQPRPLLFSWRKRFTRRPRQSFLGCPFTRLLFLSSVHSSWQAYKGSSRKPSVSISCFLLDQKRASTSERFWHLLAVFEATVLPRSPFFGTPSLPFCTAIWYIISGVFKYHQRFASSAHLACLMDIIRYHHFQPIGLHYSVDFRETDAVLGLACSIGHIHGSGQHYCCCHRSPPSFISPSSFPAAALRYAKLCATQLLLLAIFI